VEAFDHFKETESNVQIEELWQNTQFLAAFRTTISNTPIDVIPISSNEFEQHSKRKDYVKVIHQIIEVNESFHSQPVLDIRRQKGFMESFTEIANYLLTRGHVGVAVPKGNKCDRKWKCILAYINHWCKFDLIETLISFRWKEIWLPITFTGPGFKVEREDLCQLFRFRITGPPSGRLPSRFQLPSLILRNPILLKVNTLVKVRCLFNSKFCTLDGSSNDVANLVTEFVWVRISKLPTGEMSQFEGFIQSVLAWEDLTEKNAYGKRRVFVLEDIIDVIL